MNPDTSTKRASAKAAAKSHGRKPQEERWAEIIEAATEIFWEKGYDAATLQDIADRVGILKGSIYYYIDSKSDLRAHVLQEAHKDGIRMIREVAASEPRPLHRFRKMIVQHVHYVVQHMARTAVFLREIRRLTRAERVAIGVDDQAFARVFETCIFEAQTQGLICSSIDAALAAACTLSALNSLFTWDTGFKGFEISHIANHMQSTLTRGLATPAGLRLLKRIDSDDTPE